MRKKEPTENVSAAAAIPSGRTPASVGNRYDEGGGDG